MEDQAASLQVQTAFALMMLQTEVEVHRELIADLLARQGSDLAAAKSKPQIQRMVAERAKSALANRADLLPGQTTLFAKLLEQWKNSRQI